MSGDEIMVLLFCLVVGLGLWIWWYSKMLQVSPMVCPPNRRWFVIMPPVCMLALFGILRAFASHDVRDSAEYLFFYMVMGGLWTGICTSLFPLFGLSVRDDALERRNPASAIGFAGALIGVTLTFAGGNIGDGPGWWVVVFCALLSTCALFLVWLVLDLIGEVIEKVRVERDVASGWRLGGFLVAAGLILWRSVAGNWESGSETVIDFIRMGWPVSALTIFAGMVERMLPRRSNLAGPGVAIGVVLAAAYVGAAGIYVMVLGKW